MRDSQGGGESDPAEGSTGAACSIDPVGSLLHLVADRHETAVQFAFLQLAFSIIVSFAANSILIYCS